MSSPNVLIIGAGVCGLAIAQGLQKAGIAFTIFEAEEKSAFRPREWTMALHWSVPMLESLLPENLRARLRKEAVVDPSLDYSAYPNNTIGVFDGPSGKLVRELTSEGECLRVSRRKLRALCSEGIEVQYGHCLQHIAYGDGTVTASFTNGAQFTGTLLVGADGPRSSVRQQLLGDEAAAAPLDIVYLNVSFSYGDAEKALFVRRANPVTSLMVHPDCAVLLAAQDIPDPQQPKDWRFQLVVTWLGTRDPTLSNAERHREVKAKASQLAEPFRSAILWLPDAVPIQYSDLACWVPRPWDPRGGRATLAGDAAHAMPPNRGQGLNHALNDAYDFVAAVEKLAAAHAGAVEQADAIRAFSDEVVARGAEETRLSRDTAYLTLDYARFAESGIMRHGLARMPGDKAGEGEAGAL